MATSPICCPSSLEYIDRSAGAHKPFFLSLHYTAPHWPSETSEDASVAEGVKENLLHLNGGNINTAHRMIHPVGEGIG